ncbi:glycosyltransferase family 2 protein [Celeribacter sp.]|uniref:glycosyltransferase family 2 protein n=1 Tax=Celeribacter sp. TaxID=1890673 RepID=UPI003A8FACCA
MRYTIAATVRNEGPFLLEWLAWQKMLGFTDVVFAYNDCTDHSGELMQVLSNAGWCHAVEHEPGDVPPVRSGLATIHAHEVVQASDWLFVCDVDEYLVIKQGHETVGDYLAGKEREFAGISVQWKCFGTSDLDRYEDAFLHRTFTRAARSKSFANVFIKSFIYKPSRFHRLAPHVPRGMDVVGEWGEAPNRWGRANGTPYNYNPNGKRRQRTPRPSISHRGAQLNHYITKWHECIEFKMGTPCPFRKGNVDRYTNRFFEKYDRNEIEDRQALAFDARFDEVYAKILAVPRVRELHHLCVADFLRAMAEKRGEDYCDDPRYVVHMAKAAELAR